MTTETTSGDLAATLARVIGERDAAQQAEIRVNAAREREADAGGRLAGQLRQLRADVDLMAHQAGIAADSLTGLRGQTHLVTAMRTVERGLRRALAAVAEDEREASQPRSTGDAGEP